ncbi:ATP-binding protein [uncultured Chloroflexus sp.]|uniref:sensor histidine kinase n=1 Tax=uncultured Chloroflexus sp. TaxID=214040 RepID=UPI00260D760D|nr:ATP-binding protein [uncultured Chloroflexus sp.]
MTLLELTLTVATVVLAVSLILSVRRWRRFERKLATSAATSSLASPEPQQDYLMISSDPAPETQTDPVPALLVPHHQPLFLALARAVDAGVIVVDAERQIVFHNEAAIHLLAGQGSATDSGLITLLRDHQADRLARDVIADGERRELTIRPLATGRTLHLHYEPLIVQTGPPEGALIVIRDLTQISMLERARRDLVANVSHELRTPLASLKLLVETLQSAPPPDIAGRMLGQMAQEIDAVTQLVDELHELSRLESGRVSLKLAPLAVGPVIERAVERIRPQADRKQQTICIESAHDLPPALMDSDRIGQVLLNLLHNAVKFTPEGGTISVTAKVLYIAVDDPPSREDRPPHPAGTWVLISVSDTGIGIPSRELRRIFERFYKVDRARTRHAGGTGLGLAIAKHLIEGHGGRIWASSQEGHGSTFWFTLPAA